VSGAKTAARDMTGEIACLTRALKAATMRDSAGRLAERAWAESGAMRNIWRPVCNARSLPGMLTAAKAESALPDSWPLKSIEEFDFNHALA
jgi:hypothetical protein